VIQIEGVSHRYGDREVLSDINLSLVEDRIGVIGANGSGKSTLARLFNGLVVPSTGRVLVDGMDTARDGAGVRRKVAFVFADPDAQIVMPTVSEDVAFSLRRHGLGKDEVADRVRDILGRFGLGGHSDHPAHLLSSGQKQLLALASVLVTEPRPPGTPAFQRSEAAPGTCLGAGHRAGGPGLRRADDAVGHAQQPAGGRTP